VVALLQKPRRRSLVVLSLLVGLGIPAQGVLGGISVLTDLNPWVVGCHFLLSMALIAGAYALWRRTASGDGPARLVVPAPLGVLARVTAAAALAVIVAGTIVTGSGPHAGDEHAKRNGLDPQAVSQFHADLVFLLIGLSVALWFALRAVSAPRAAVRAAVVLVIVELAQGLIGFVQYFTHLPVILVAFHMLGASLVWTATLAVLWSLRARPTLAASTELTAESVSDPEAIAADDSAIAAPAGLAAPAGSASADNPVTASH
jgi:cytochrome c oxidase assembly protein subunit 15